MAILITAAHWRQQFEWDIHAPIALKAGVPQHIMDAVWKREAPRDLDPQSQAVYDVALALHQDCKLVPGTKHQAETVLGEQGVMDLIGICGYYALLAMVLNARPE